MSRFVGYLVLFLLGACACASAAATGAASASRASVLARQGDAQGDSESPAGVVKRHRQRVVTASDTQTELPKEEDRADESAEDLSSVPVEADDVTPPNECVEDDKTKCECCHYFKFEQPTEGTVEVSDTPRLFCPCETHDTRALEGPDGYSYEGDCGCAPQLRKIRGYDRPEEVSSLRKRCYCFHNPNEIEPVSASTRALSYSDLTNSAALVRPQYT